MVMEHLRMNGAYWGLTALDLMGKLDAVDREEVVSWVLQCQHECGSLIYSDTFCGYRFLLFDICFPIKSGASTITVYKTNKNLFAKM